MAQCDEILLQIVTTATAKLLMVHLEISHLPAPLASPTIPAQYFVSQDFICIRLQPHFEVFSIRFHDAVVAYCRKICRCSAGRNRKDRDIACKSASGFPLSRFAPARKSAQIISRQ
jgi:hypothetical protein